MKTKPFAILAVICAFSARAAEIMKAENTDAMNLPSSWVGDVVPGVDDFILWHPFTTTQSISLGGDLSVRGVILTNIADKASINFGASGETGVLTVGSGGLYCANSGKTITIYTKTQLACDQLWSNRGGTLIFGSDIDLNGKVLAVYNSLEAKGSANPHDGTIEMTAGYWKMSSGTHAETVDFLIRRNAGVQFNQEPAKDGVARARSVTLDGSGHYDGAAVYSNGRKNENAHDVVTGALTVTNGLGLVRLNPDAARHQTLEFGSFANGVGSTTWFRGTNLGLSPMADLVAGYSTLKFGVAPTLVGGGGAAGSTSVSLISYAVCATNDSDYGYSFATYDSTYGVRPLDLETEFAPSLASGSKGSENVRLCNSTSGQQVVTTLDSGTTEINSLLLDTPNGTKGDGGVLVTGPSDAVLRVKSGLVYARQMMSDVVTNDALTIADITLDFNGKGAQIISRQTKQSNMTSNAPLQLDCILANDGGEGVSFSSVANRGLIYLYGTNTSAYAGPTRVLNGNVRLCKSKDPATKLPYPAIPGDLHIYGGSVLNNGNQLKTTASVFVHGGSYILRGGASNSGSGASQTFRNLLIEANGAATFGATGTSPGSSTIDDVSLSGGTMNVTRGHKTYARHFALSGGTLTLGRWYGKYRSLLQMNGGLSLTNVPLATLASAYVPVTLECGSYDNANAAFVRGADIYLSNGLTFAGNAGNTNTVCISSQTPAVVDGVGQCPWGLVHLDSSETFEIGDGAADVDLAINAVLTDDEVDALAGGLVKTGAGTLLLANTNGYTLATDVRSGRLIADGALAGDVTVADGAVFRGGDRALSGTLAVAGDVTFSAGAEFEVEPGAVTMVAGDVTASATPVALKDGSVLTDDVKVLSAKSIAGSFTLDVPKFKAKVCKGGTELWLVRSTPFVFSVR